MNLVSIKIWAKKGHPIKFVTLPNDTTPADHIAELYLPPYPFSHCFITFKKPIYDPKVLAEINAIISEFKNDRTMPNGISKYFYQ